MSDFKFVISDPKTKKSFSTTISQDKLPNIIGKKMGEKIDGSLIGLSGYELEITGGTDKDGFPMLPSIQGSVRKKIILSSIPGFRPKIRGQRKRKTVRGNTISTEISQINTKIVKYGSKPIEEIFKKEPAEEGD